MSTYRMSAVALALFALLGCEADLVRPPDFGPQPEPDAYLAPTTTTPLDLGTLGGQHSWGSGIGPDGAVVGHSFAYGGVTRGFLWLENHGMSELDGDLGAGWSVAVAVNDKHQIAGYSGPASGGFRAVRWWHGLSDLGVLPGGSFSIARGINVDGSVVGYTDGTPYRAFLWRDGRMTQLAHLPGGTYAVATGINIHGHIVGYGRSAVGDRAIVWVDGVPNALPPPTDYPNSYAVGINADGTVVGTTGGTDGRAVVWRGGVPALLDDFGAVTSGATGVNDDGEIVGYATFATATRALLWKSDGSVTELGSLGGSYSRAAAINNDGQIAGTSTREDGTYAAVRWTAPRGDAPPLRFTYHCMDDNGPTPLAYYWVQTGDRPGCGVVPWHRKAYILEYFRDKPVGTEMEVCYNQILASGWVHIGDPLSYKPPKGYDNKCGFRQNVTVEHYLLSWQVPIKRVF